MNACKNIVGRIKKALGIISVATVQMLFGLQVSAQDFGYTGQVQTFTASQTGKYKVTLNGAAGGWPADMDEYHKTYNYIGHGGKIVGYINLRAGDTLYVTVGGQGGKNSGGYNGGGSGTNGSYGGGGITAVYTSLIGDGQTTNYENSTEKIVAAAGGGGGTGQNYAAADKLVFLAGTGSSAGFAGGSVTYHFNNVNYNTAAAAQQNYYGYKFGAGQDAFSTQTNGGYGGGGGAGIMGGFANPDGRGGGSAGAGYNNKLYDIEVAATSEGTGNGSASITYVGAVQQTIIVNANDRGTWNGSTGITTLKGTTGQSEYIDNPQAKPGYTFQYWEMTDQDGNKSVFNGGNLQYDWGSISLRAVYLADLKLTATNIQGGLVSLSLVEDDEYNKYFRIYKSTDNQTWSFLSQSFEGTSQSNKNGQIGQQQNQTLETGKYTFQIRGATGGMNGTDFSVGLGGDSSGEYFNTVTNQIVGWCIGQTPGYSQSGGYNGGGAGGQGTYYEGHFDGDGGGAGGCSNLNIGYAKTMRQSSENDLLIVAGGGGGVGGYNDANWRWQTAGGGGGGLTGNKGAGGNDGTGGTQTGGGSQGGSWGQGGRGADNGGGGPGSASGKGGGGGGYYGGGGGHFGAGVNGGGGGSGHIGWRVTNGNTVTNGSQNNQRYSGSGSWSYSDSKQYLQNIITTDFTDQAAPNAPLDKGLTYSGQNININFLENGDNGTITYFKAASYNAANNQLLKESNTLQYLCISGVDKYYYYIDNNSTGTAGKQHQQTAQTYVTVSGSSIDRWLHVCVVDKKGNVGPTTNIKIPSYVVITYNKNSSQATGTDNQTQTVGFGETATIKKITDIGVQNDGYRFKAWNNKQDGSGSYSYHEGDRVQYNTLVQRHGYSVTLYAQWERTYWLYVDPNNGSWLDKHDIVRNETNTSDFQTTATNKTYTNVARFKMGQGDTKTILDAVRLGYNFKGWKISRAKYS